MLGAGPTAGVLTTDSPVHYIPWTSLNTRTHVARSAEEQQFNSVDQTAESEDDQEQWADVDVQGKGATDVLFRRQLLRSTAEYHLCVEYQPLQTYGNISIVSTKQLQTSDFAPIAAPLWVTLGIHPFLIAYEWPLCANVMSSTKLEVLHNQLHCPQSGTCDGYRQDALKFWCLDM